MSKKSIFVGTNALNPGNYMHKRDITTLRHRSSVLPLHSSVSLQALQPFLGPWPLFQFLDVFTRTVSLWTSDHLVARLLPTNKTAYTKHKHIQTSLPQVGFEPTTPVFEPAKSVHASDRAATVIGYFVITLSKSIII
jgi:hypothetical protein